MLVIADGDQPGDKVTITDLAGEILAEHTRPAPGIGYVGNGPAARYAERQPRVRQVFDELQGEFIEQVAELEAAGHRTREWDRVTTECTERAQAAAQSLLAEFRAA